MSNKCVLPWIHTELSTNGKFRPCCLFKDFIKKPDGTHYSVQNGDSIEDVFKSEYMQKIRQDFLAGKKIRECDACWQVEQSGGVSKRMNDNKTFNVYNSMIDPKIIYMGIKFGNICNLKCRICGSQSSSKWAQEEMKIYGSNSDAYHIAKNNLKDGSWPRESTKFWSDIIQVLPAISLMEFTGGEPMMIQEQFELLKISKDNGWSKKQKVHYNTNGTHFPEYAIDNIWPFFKHVDIAFSIDDVGPRFEYQRFGAEWNLVNDNIERFHKAKSKSKNITTQVCLTINMFNIFNVENLFKWINTKTFDHVYVNFLHSPKEYCVKYLPLKYKNIITEKLLNYAGPEQYRNQIQTFLKFMNETFDETVSVHSKRTQKILGSDKFRQEKFYKIFPEYKGLIDE